MEDEYEQIQMEQEHGIIPDEPPPLETPLPRIFVNYNQEVDKDVTHNEWMKYIDSNAAKWVDESSERICQPPSVMPGAQFQLTHTPRKRPAQSELQPHKILVTLPPPIQGGILCK